MKRLAKTFAQEWCRPNDPDHADETLVRTLTTAMLAFHAVARGVEERAQAALGGRPSPPPETFARHLAAEVNEAHQALDRLGAPKTKMVWNRNRDGKQEITIGLAERIVALRASAPPQTDAAAGARATTISVLGRLEFAIKAGAPNADLLRAAHAELLAAADGRTARTEAAPQEIERRRIAAYRAARICEPNMDQFAGAMAVYNAAFPEAYIDDAEALHAASAATPHAVPRETLERLESEFRHSALVAGQFSVESTEPDFGADAASRAEVFTECADKIRAALAAVAPAPTQEKD